MSRYHAYVNSASILLSGYNGTEPFASFLKKYFARGKKFGSTDRKQVSHLCYCYFRLGKALRAWPVEERIIAALFCCSDKPHPVLEAFQPAWNQQTSIAIEDKLQLLEPGLTATEIFPWKDLLSDGIDASSFAASHLQQPDLFLRSRPGKKEQVAQKLLSAGIDFRLVNNTCFALSNSTPVDQLLELNREAVVQDYSSQRVAELFPAALLSVKNGAFAWDCCAASGGKSIMLKDYVPSVHLIVSDIRESIIANLKKRFNEAGISGYKSAVIDLTKPAIALQPHAFNLILADTPCSGSGTWGRTPEQLYFFEKEKIDHYSSLQKKIIPNLIPHLAPGGYLLYITCSVFRAENEEAVDFITRNFSLELKEMNLFKGYHDKADTMFGALLQRPL